MRVTKPVIFLMGPTASGKTGLALALVERLPLDIISVDSALVYRGMNVGTAKPSADELRRAPHRLIDIREPDEPYSAADFRADALEAIAEIHAKGRVPLLVGGTMLYFRALEHGLSDLPSADANTRARLEHELAENGLTALHERLREVDLASAERIHVHDTQRILRALEVFEITGKPMSQWWEQQAKDRLPHPIVKIALSPADRGILHERIAQRFDQMLENGFVDEVRALRLRPGMSPDLPSMRAVGYRQVWQYLDGEGSYEEMREKGIVATRQLAKRQLTWLRADPEVRWFGGDDPDHLEKVLKMLQQTIF